MSRRTIAIATALSVLALGSHLITANANPLARQYFAQGVEKHLLGNHQGAISHFNKSIEIDPKDEFVCTFRGLEKS